MTQDQPCLSCRKPKSHHACGVCGERVCRDCAVFLEAGTFAFLDKLPELLSFSYYCAPCYDQNVTPELERYQELLERAKAVYFFFDSRKKPMQTLKRARDEITVVECEDRDETILRMGFQAAAQGFNAVVDARVECEKVRNHGYQKMRWRGVGRPAQVDAERLERHELSEQY